VAAPHSPGQGDKSPLFLPGKGPGVLCLHGYSGTPYEVAPLARALAAAGYAVAAPLLPGHGQTAAALAATSRQDWLAAAAAALAELRAATGDRPAAVVGFSMGGLLALRLAASAQPGTLSALVLMSVPLRLPSWQAAVLRGLDHLPGFLRRHRWATLRKRGGSDVTDLQARSENPSLGEMPLAGLCEMVTLADEVRRELSAIVLPALVVHGERDHTVPPYASFELAGRLASATVEKLWLPRSGHLVAVDVERTELATAVLRFLATHHPAPEVSRP
jgi:carboxylesterase